MKKRMAWLPVLLGVILCAEKLFLKIMQNRSVEIIGSADGPTSIYLAGSIGNGGYLLMGTGVIVLLTGIILLVKRKISDKKD